MAVETATQPAAKPAAAAEEEARMAAEASVAELARLAKEARALEKPLVKTAEQLRAETKLAKLRRLTRKQEAAAAKAAQRIGKVAAAAEAAPEEERAAAELVGKEAWTAFGGGAIEPLLEHTPLIDLEYLVALAEGDGVIFPGKGRGLIKQLLTPSRTTLSNGQLIPLRRRVGARGRVRRLGPARRDPC